MNSNEFKLFCFLFVQKIQLYTQKVQVFEEKVQVYVEMCKTLWYNKVTNRLLEVMDYEI